VTQPATGVWAALSSEIARNPAEEDGFGLYERLAESVDPAGFRPQLAPDIEVKEFKLRWGNDYAMIANPRDLLHFRLEPGEVELLPLMDGRHTVKDIVIERFQDSGDMELSGVADLVRQLHVGGFLTTPFVNVDEMVRRAIDPVPAAREKAREFVRSLSIEWKGADRLVSWIYRHVLKYFFNRVVLVLVGLLAMAGFFAFIALYRQHRFGLGGESAAAASLIILAMNYLLTFAHELAHAVVLTRNGRRIKSAGFMIYFGSPAFFVESSDGLMMDRKQRIVQSFAGPYAEILIAGAAAFFAWAFPDAPAASLLYKFALLNYFIIFLNLVPFLELDGYWILADLIQVPDLRPRSLQFFRYDLWRKIRTREHFNKQEVGLALYATLGVLFTIFSVYTSIFFWKEIFGGLVSDLWHAGVVGRILLVALILFVTGPVLRGLITAGRSLARKVRALVERIRFRLQTTWRVEAAQLIDAMPMFEDLPEDVLSDLAGRVRLRTFPAGKPIFRQGDEPDAFYVVRRGTLHVIEENPETGTERLLRVLGRGESFGEVGIVTGAKRAATVRPVEDAEVFEVDRPTFDHLLSNMIHVPEFAPTLQSVAELRELPPFASLEFASLAEVREHGDWVNVTPGDTIIRQGDVGDAFFVIGSGQVEVLKDGELVATQGAGAHFGEIALLADVPRTASVVAKTPVRVFRLDREGFDRIVAGAFRRGTLDPSAPIERTSQH
jgi:CRP-like cAMP-binding protein/Zn-dependent protease